MSKALLLQLFLCLGLPILGTASTLTVATSSNIPSGTPVDGLAASSNSYGLSYSPPNPNTTSVTVNSTTPNMNVGSFNFAVATGGTSADKAFTLTLTIGSDQYNFSGTWDPDVTGDPYGTIALAGATGTTGSQMFAGGEFATDTDYGYVVGISAGATSSAPYAPTGKTDGLYVFVKTVPSSVPEPATWGAMAFGLVALTGLGLRRRAVKG